MSALLRDWPFKLLAVVVAAVTWTAIATGDRGRVSVAVAIEYVGLDRGLLLTGAPRDTVEVDVSVARWALSRFRPDALRARVDLSHVGEGEQIVALAPADVLAPAGVRVRRVEPGRVRLHLVRAGESTVRVVPVVRGTPAPGHRVAAVHVEPIAVQVKGPRSTIESGESVRTAPVDVTGRKSGVTRSVGLALPDSVSAVSDDKVQVTVDIRAE